MSIATDEKLGERGLQLTPVLGITERYLSSYMLVHCLRKKEDITENRGK
jgi:hypothetical protein